MTPATADAAPPHHPEVAVVRQPILDVRRKVLGYELTFGKEHLEPATAEAGPTAPATSALLLDVFADLGLERLAGAYPAWLSVARDWLVDVGMPPLRPDRAVLQIASYPCYTLALEGYDGRTDLKGLLDLCSTVKVDVAGREQRDIELIIAEPVRHGARLIARGVASHEAFKRCRALGFTGFQGEFFARPRVVRGRGVATSAIGALRTAGELSQGNASFEELDRIIAGDVGLSLKLLRYVNSAYFTLPRTLGSVREALALLGTRTVSRWATIMALSSLPDAPNELIGLSLHRARMCETLGASLDAAQRDSCFTVGLFSVADALLGAPMAEVLDSLPFSSEIREALLHHTGPKGELLAAVLAYERGEFPKLPSTLKELDGTLAAAYREAVEWAEQAASATP